MLRGVSRLVALASAASLAMVPALAAAQAPAVPVNIQIARIDTNCLVTQSVTKQYPAALVLNRVTTTAVASKWTQVNQADYTRTIAAAPTIVTGKVWKQAGKLTWVQVLRKRPSGSLLTEYCFRYDGSLAKVQLHLANATSANRAAATVWLDSSGNVLAKKDTLHVGDPTLYPKVTNLPFYTVIQQTVPASMMASPAPAAT